MLLNRLMTRQGQNGVDPVGRPAKSIFSKGYFCLGLLLVTAFTVQELGNFTWPWLAELQSDDVYKQLSGFVLVAYLARQWRCSLLRNRGLMQQAAKLLNRHKLLGAMAPLFFFAHAQHTGFAYTQILSLAYFGIFLTGNFNVEITGIRKDWFRKLWITLHVGLATVLGLSFGLPYLHQLCLPMIALVAPDFTVYRTVSKNAPLLPVSPSVHRRSRPIRGKQS